jgi:hypothetical protein
MTRTRLLALTVATSAALLLGGCGSDGSKDDAAKPSKATSTSPAEAASSGAPSASKPTRKPTETPTPTPSNTPAKPGTFIDYEAINEDGIRIASAADTAKLTGAPTDFKAFVGTLIEKQAAKGVEGCSEAPLIYVTQIDTNGWARGSYSIPGCGGSGALWAKSGRSWTEAWSGQSLVDCATLHRYAFPSRLAGDTCDSGGGTKPYSR